MLQETHCTAENEQKWRSEWGNNMYFSNGASNARGVAIIITENYEYKKLKVEKDTEGRFLILEIERQGTFTQLVIFMHRQEILNEINNGASLILPPS